MVAAAQRLSRQPWWDRPAYSASYGLFLLAGALYFGISIGAYTVTDRGTNQLTATSGVSTAILDTVGKTTWLATYQPAKADAPFANQSLIEFDAPLPYASGSIVMPSPRWQTTNPYFWKVSWKLADATWTTTEPVDRTPILAVKFEYIPPQVPFVLPSEVDFSGIGDGFEIVSLNGAMYAVNHHQGNVSLKCRNPNNLSSPCAGWTMAGFRVPNTAGAAFASNSLLDSDTEYNETPGTVKVTYAMVSGEHRLYYPVATRAGTGVLCANLTTLKSCGFLKLTGDMNVGLFGAYIGFGSFTNGTNPIRGYVGIGADLHCFEVDGTQPVGSKLCSAYPMTSLFTAAGLDWYLASSFINNGYLVAAPLASDGASGMAVKTAYCVQLTTNTKCGSAGQLTFASAGGVVPYLSSAGALIGVCNSASQCLSMSNGSLTPPAAFSSWLTGAKSWLNYQYTGYSLNPLVFNSRVLINGDDATGAVDCFDFTTNARCANFPRYQNKGYAAYGLRADLTLPNCIWLFGDAGIAASVNGATGLDCTDSTYNLSTIVMPKTAYGVDDLLNNVPAWRKVVIDQTLAWGTQINSTSVDGSGNADGLLVQLYDYDPNTGAAPTPFLQSYLPVNSYEWDISAVSFASHPSIQAKIIAKRANNNPIPNTAWVDVLWSGDPVQFSFKTYPITTGGGSFGVCTAYATLTSQSRFSNNTVIETLVSQSNALQKDGAYFSTSNQGYSLSGGDAPVNNGTGRLYFQPGFIESEASGFITGFYQDIDGSNTAVETVQSLSGPFLTAKEPGITGYASTPLQLNNLTATQRDRFLLSASGVPMTHSSIGMTVAQANTRAMQRVSYLRGDQSQESILFRARAHTLGAMIGTGASVLPKQATGGTPNTADVGYANFVKNTVRSSAMVFTAANDGFVHGMKFSANYSGTQVTTPVFSAGFNFMPARVLYRMYAYPEKTLSELLQAPFYFDQTPMLIDVDLSNGVGNNWRTLLLGHFGRGAPGAYALDVTAADTVTESSNNLSLWEMSERSSDTTIANHMGYVTSPPLAMPTNPSFSGQVAKVKTATGYRFAWFFGNGGGSRAGSATLFMVYLDQVSNGMPAYKAFTVDAGPDNGLSTPYPYDSDGDGYVDRVYAGDLKGAMWRIDLGLPASSPTVTAVYRADVPIVSAPVAVASADRNQPYVVFGTGQPDITPLRWANPKLASVPYALYGVLDNQGLEPLRSLSLQTTTSASYQRVNLPVDDLTYRGWSLSLSGWGMVVANPLLHPAADEVSFIAMRPPSASAGVCSNGNSYEIRLNPRTGGQALGFKSTGLSVDGIIGRQLSQARASALQYGVNKTVKTVASPTLTEQAQIKPPRFRGRVWWREVTQQQ